jgi:hypothetical protein
MKNELYKIYTLRFKCFFKKTREDNLVLHQYLGASRLLIFLTIGFFHLPVCIYPNSYYLSPLGNDNNSGTSINAPFFSLNKAWSVVAPGDLIYMRGGTYIYNNEQILINKSGTANNLIKVWAYPGETPVIKAGTLNYTPNGWYTGILVNGNYLHFKGIEITGYIQLTSTHYYYGFQAYSVNHCIFENLNVHHNGFGMSFVTECNDNLILNCDAHHNSDRLTSIGQATAWGGADGITIRYCSASTINTIRGCRMYWNSDDGFDGFYNDGMLIIEDSWIWANGYQPGLTPIDLDSYNTGGDGQGAKLGPTTSDYSTEIKREVRFCLAFNNRSSAFDQNMAKCAIALNNNTAYNNMRGYNLKHWSSNPGDLDLHIVHALKNNISYANTFSSAPIGLVSIESIVDHCTFVNVSWQCTPNPAFTLTNNDFVSVSPTGMDGPRQIDGSLPEVSFMHLAVGSDLIDAGINVNLPFNGSAPDLGAFETSPVTFNTITTGAINGGPFCAGSSVSVPFTATGTFNSSNIFTAQLSDASGSFTSPVTIGSLASITFGTISAVIPSGTASGSSYLIRVIASNPFTTGTSNPSNLVVNALASASASITASPSTAICFGTSVTFTAVPSNGGTSPSYQWKLNGSNVGTNSATYTNSSLANNSVVSCVMTSNAACITGNPVSSNAIIMAINSNLPASVNISATATTLCAGTDVTFTAVATNGGAIPTFQWKKNGINVGTNSSSYSTNTLVNNDVITCVMISSFSCATGSPVTSNAITMVVNPNLPASTSITTSLTTICSGTNVTFTAIPTNGGTNPSYQWKMNGNNVGSNSPSYSSSSLANNNVVTCVMTSNATCVIGIPATSNAITMTVNPILPASVTIAASATNICSGMNVTFTASPTNGGASPSYQWKLNGSNVGSNSTTFSNNSLTNNNVVTCMMTSNATCVASSPATSNAITMTVNPSLPVNVIISASATSVCMGTNVIFTATPSNGGNSPSYQWKKNGTNVGTNSATYTYNDLQNNDVISCILTSNASCVPSSQAISNSLTIQVSPCSNQAPIISNQQFNINENSLNGALVGNVIASDPNAGQTLSYSILSGNTNNAFQINQSTGNISVSNSSALNYELITNYILVVKVQDNATTPLSSQANITINVNDLNEIPSASDDAFSILENAAFSTLVGIISASDPDIGQTLTFSIIGGNTNGAFAINPASGVITVANSSALNYETITWFALIVKVQDNGQGMLNSQCTITIDLSNVNEAPIILNQSFNVNENSSNGTVVGIVLASDPDIGQAITYSIQSGNTNGTFAINVLTGCITVSNSSLLNFESFPVFNLVVRIQDNYSTSLSSQAIVTVVLNNLNEMPIISDDAFSILENSLNGSTVGTLNATDPDAGQTLTYSIIGGNTYGAFSLTSDGKIKVANSSAINYELIPLFFLIVKVQDNGTGNLSNQATIVIDLSDVNENPIINNQSYVLAAYSSNGTVVGIVSASDPDAGQIVSYSINSGNINNAFSINTYSGSLTVANSLALNPLNNPTFYLTIKVTDNGSGPLSSYGMVTVAITSTSNAPPPLINNQSTSNNENVSNTTIFANLLAYDDKSISISGTDTYNLTNNHSYILTNDGKQIENVAPLSSQIIDKMIEVYPNPNSSGFIKINLNAIFPEADVKLYDLEGKCLLNKKYSFEQYIQLEILTIPRGTYILSLNIQNYKFNYRIIRM